MYAKKLLGCILIVAGFIAFGNYWGERIGGTAALASPARASNDAVGFNQVQPIFEQHCVMCHSGGNAAAGLRLTSYQEVKEGKDHIVRPGQPEQSEMVKRITGEVEPRMPLGREPLSEDEIDVIVQWIEGGA